MDTANDSVDWGIFVRNPYEKVRLVHFTLSELFRDTGIIDGEEDRTDSPYHYAAGNRADHKRADAALLKTIRSVVEYGSTLLGETDAYKENPDFVPERYARSVGRDSSGYALTGGIVKGQREALLATGLFKITDHEQYISSGQYRTITAIEPKSSEVREILKLLLKDGDGKDKLHFTDANRLVSPFEADRLAAEYEKKKLTKEQPKKSTTITGLHLRKRAAELLLGRS